MKSTDFSKLHLAKRVYFRGLKVAQEVKSFEIDEEEKDGFKICINDEWYTEDGFYWAEKNEDDFDIIAFDIDEPFDVENLTEEQIVEIVNSNNFKKLSRNGWDKIREESKNKPRNPRIARADLKQLSEERSAYIERISREAMGKMRENFGLDKEELLHEVSVKIAKIQLGRISDYDYRDLVLDILKKELLEHLK